MLKFQKNRQAFTLVEIMIVVAIIALLAAVASVSILRSRTTSRETTVVGNLKALLSSLEIYRSVNQSYPATNTWMASMYGADCDSGTSPDPDFGPPTFCVALTGTTVGDYSYTYTGAAAPAQTFSILATPTVLGSTGSRSFYADESGLIAHCNGVATVAHFTDNDEQTIDAIPTDCD